MTNAELLPNIIELYLPSLEGVTPNPHKLTCWEWGDPKNQNVLLCVHGLTRNGRDFDFLARALSHRYRVLCPDMPGRGQSDWLSPPAAYNPGQYVSDIQHMLNRLNIERVDWVGTSMGGIIGMIAAGLTPDRIRKMVLNDIGAMIPKAALERLKLYVGQLMRFPSRQAMESGLREVLAPWGMTESWQWRHVVEHSLRELADGSWEFTYDPAIAQAFVGAQELKDADLSHVWNAVQCPILLLRGAESDLLLHDTAVQMAARENVTLVEIPHTGHAPHLMSDEQIKLIVDWL